MSVEEHLLPNETIKYSSPKPVHLDKDSTNYWLYITDMRLIFYEKSHLVQEKLSDIDYFVYREKGGIFPKTYIRLWIGTKKTDVIGDRDNIKQIRNELQKYIKRKLKKGGIIALPKDSDMFSFKKARGSL